MAVVTLELESADVPDAGEKVSSFSVSFAASTPGAVGGFPEAAAEPLAPAGVAAADEADTELLLGAGANWGGSSLSMSCFPNSHPGGSVSSEQSASRTVDSQTRLV